MTLKKALLRGLLGFPLGIFISTTISLIISVIKGTGEFYSVVPSLVDSMGNELSASVLQFFLSGLLGFAFASGSAVFEVEHWSIAKQTILHFFITSIVMSPVAYLCNWMDHSIAGFMVYFGSFGGMYLVSWFAQYRYWKLRVQKINDKFQNK